MNDDRLDDVRSKALDRIDASRKASVWLLVAAGVFETVAFIAIVLLMDFRDPLHLLVFLCACLVYAPLAFGLFALKFYVDLSTQRILQALEMATIAD